MSEPRAKEPKKTDRFAGNVGVSEKADLRRRLLSARDAIPQEERRRRNADLISRAAALPAFVNASAILLYVPVGSEIDVRPLMAEAWRRGVPVGLPICDRATRTLVFRRAFSDVPLIEGAFGIPVPPEDALTLSPDADAVCIVPALGYDRERRRIGYGGGYYDRFLGTFAGTSVGLAYRESLLDSVLAEAHDLPVRILVTEDGVL